MIKLECFKSIELSQKEIRTITTQIYQIIIKIYNFDGDPKLSKVQRHA